MPSQLPKRTRPHVARGPARARRPRARLGPRDGQVRPPAAAPARSPALLRFTRYGIPALVVLAGIVALGFGTQSSLIGGGSLIGAGLAIWLIAWLYRVGVASDETREAEERARRFFDRTGRWPEG
jgi:hypothetical protein